MGLRTLVLAFVLLALVAYVSSAPFPSDSSESKSRDISESNEESKSVHSDESGSASVEKHDDHHPEAGHKHRRDVASQTASPCSEGARPATSDNSDSTASSITTAAPASSTTVAAEGKLELDVQEFYPAQSLFP